MERSRAPRVWLLLSYRAGENTQIRALATALGWPVEEKRLAYRPLAWRSHLLRGENLSGVDLDRSDPLTPPWPDLLISAAVRNEPVARWIRRRAGQPVKLVFLGRVWAALEHFDLVVTTPQYRLPEHPRVLHNLTTQQAITPEWLSAARQQWSASLAALPRPRVAVLVGGSSGPYALDGPCAARLAREASELVASGGSLLVTTSARTPPAAVEALAANLRVAHRFHRWQAQADDNPYPGFLALADQLVVTGDSIAMLSEACATGKPVHIFDLGTGEQAMGPVAARLAPPSPWRGWNRQRLNALAYRLLMLIGPRRLSRDIRLAHRALVASGRAVWLGQPWTGEPPPLEDRSRTVARVRQLPGLVASSPPPRTWLLLGLKAGDNTQLRALAAALGWPLEERRLVYRPWELVAGRLLGATLLGVDSARSDPLTPPWPELILTAGRRNEPVARWIRRQAGSGMRIVHLGRPWAPLGVFDLIITTPQYQLPALPQVLVNQLPLHPMDPEPLTRAAGHWAPRLAHLPRPWTAVLVGGASGPYHFDAPEARRLGEALNALVARQGGSLLITTSARTGGVASNALAKSVSAPQYFHHWQQAGEENPYPAFLALADGLVVTGDSMSMLAEACATGKPVQVFPMGQGRFAMGPGTTDPPPSWWRDPRNWRFRALSHRLAMDLAPRRLRRDIRVMVDSLVAAGRIGWLGEDPPTVDEFSTTDLARAVDRVRGLMGQTGDPGELSPSPAAAIVSGSRGEI